jgi:hypothetical protein
MTCRDIERLILEKKDRPWKDEERLGVEAHLQECADCREFEAGLRGIREDLEDPDWYPLPEFLNLRTKQMAFDVLDGKTPESVPTGKRISVPGPILAVLGVLTFLTGVWIFLSLAGIDSGGTIKDLPLAARASILLIAQNSLILFFAPVILRAIRHTANENHEFQ